MPGQDQSAFGEAGGFTHPSHCLCTRHPLANLLAHKLPEHVGHSSSFTRHCSCPDAVPHTGCDQTPSGCASPNPPAQTAVVRPRAEHRGCCSAEERSRCCRHGESRTLKHVCVTTQPSQSATESPSCLKGAHTAAVGRSSTVGRSTTVHRTHTSPGVRMSCSSTGSFSHLQRSHTDDPAGILL